MQWLFHDYITTNSRTLLQTYFYYYKSAKEHMWSQYFLEQFSNFNNFRRLLTLDTTLGVLGSGSVSIQPLLSLESFPTAWTKPRISPISNDWSDRCDDSWSLTGVITWLWDWRLWKYKFRFKQSSQGWVSLLSAYLRDPLRPHPWNWDWAATLETLNKVCRKVLGSIVHQ